jgi:hypothetical protein
LNLEGTGQTVYFTPQNGAPFVHTIELWTYRFPNPRALPMILEERFEDETNVTERRITGSTTTQVSSALFDIPAGFDVEGLP